MPDPISLTFLGHSAWRIRHGSSDILIDPFLTGNPAATVKADDLSPTHIILSHAHGDHLGDTVEIAKRSGAQVIATFELAEWLEKQGCNAWGMSIGGGRDFDFGRVKLTIAHHGSSLPDGSYAGSPAGILLTIDGRTIYHAGDTALFLDMKLIGEMNSIDLAILPIGDNYTMGIDDAVRAAEMLSPGLVIPMHYNTWPPIAADPEEFRTKLERRGIKGTTLAVDATHTLE
jgi:L-ascorbate metabolism protein UlaG (beta-lactamase superfamily)